MSQSTTADSGQWHVSHLSTWNVSIESPLHRMRVQSSIPGLISHTWVVKMGHKTNTSYLWLWPSNCNHWHAWFYLTTGNFQVFCSFPDDYLNVIGIVSLTGEKSDKALLSHNCDSSTLVKIVIFGSIPVSLSIVISSPFYYYLSLYVFCLQGLVLSNLRTSLTGVARYQKTS